MRPPVAAVVSRTVRQRRPSPVSVPPLDLPPRWRARRVAVPQRRRRSGRHARRFRARRPSAASARGARAHTGSCSRRSTRPSSRSRSGSAPRCSAGSTECSTAGELARARRSPPAHRVQLEADVRQHQGPVPRQRAARVPGLVRPLPRRQSVVDRDGSHRTPQRARVRATRSRQRRGRRAGLLPTGSSNCTIRGCSTSPASSLARPRS